MCIRDSLITYFPVGQPEELLIEQAVQQVKAFGLVGLTIEDANIFFNELMHFGTAVP